MNSQPTNQPPEGREDEKKMHFLIKAGKGHLFSLSERKIIFEAMEQYAATPPATVSTQNEITNLCDIAINHCDKYLSDGQIHHNSLKQTFVSIRHLASTPPATVIQDLKNIVENAHMAGQRNAGIDPSYHAALHYYKTEVEPSSPAPTVIQPLQWVKEKLLSFIIWLDKNPVQLERSREVIVDTFLSESTPPNQLSCIEVKELAQAHAKAYGSHPLGHETSFYDGFKAGYAASEGEEAIGFAEWKDKYFCSTYAIEGRTYSLREYEHIKTIPTVLYGEHYNIRQLYNLYKCKK